MQMRRLIFCLLLSTIAAAQSGEVLPNENLVADGIPKIPTALAESVDRYSNFRAASLTSWHPTRREMLIATALPTCRKFTGSPCPAGRARS